MTCKICHKEIPDGSVYCNHCGRKQVAAKRRTRTHKRPRGQGTICYRKDRKCYMATAPATAAGTGRKYIGCYPTYAKASAALDEYLQGKRPDLYNAAFSQIYELWSAMHFSTLSDSGVRAYKAAYKSAVDLHGAKFRDLKTVDFQLVIDQVAEKYSRAKCVQTRQLFSLLCKYAMQNDVIDKNYAEFVKMPRTEKREKPVFTATELAALWAHKEDERVQKILFMCYSGFRVSEVFAIRRDNVHIDDGYIIGGIKTSAGRNRVVPIADCVKPFVRLWLDKYDGDVLLPGTAEHFRVYEFYPALSELGFIDPPEVVTREDKKGYSYTHLEFKNPRLTPHSCRHTFASLSAAAGMPPEVLQKIIGHASYQTTAEIYVHNNLQQLTAGINLLSQPDV